MEKEGKGREGGKGKWEVREERRTGKWKGGKERYRGVWENKINDRGGIREVREEHRHNTKYITTNIRLF